MKGLINLYKPEGITSSDAVIKARRILCEKKTGHMGTLDPMAKGVLLIGVGKGTRLFDYFLSKDKAYRAEFRFGFATDTLDITGQITHETDVVPDKQLVQSAIKYFIGKQSQIPPAYSAKKINGRKAYELARKGIEVDIKPAEIEVFDLQLIDETAENSYIFEIHCSSGTYIRSLCRDIAEKLGSLAVMTGLERIRCGRFGIASSVNLSELEERKNNALISLEDALSDLERLELPDRFYDDICSGRKVELADSPGRFALYCKEELFGIGESSSEGYLKIVTYLKD